MTVKVPFMGDEVEVRKLAVGAIMDLQKIIDASNKDDSELAQLKLLRDVMRIAVVGAEDITDEEFNQFPLSELTSLSEAIMAASGLGGVEGN